jgi:HEAT repeat protein
VPWRDLEPLLRDERWYVVRNAVHLAAEMGHEEVAEHAARLMGHGDVRVRRETVRAMGRLAGTSTVRVLAQALSDSDASVRTLAANALGRKGGPEQKAQLFARIEDRNFPSLASEEMEAILGAYAELAQDKAVPLLMRLWKKNLFSAKPSTVRIAAVLALARIRGAAATSALQAAAKSDEQIIKRAGAEALQRRAGGLSEES